MIWQRVLALRGATALCAPRMPHIGPFRAHLYKELGAMCYACMCMCVCVQTTTESGSKTRWLGALCCSLLAAESEELEELFDSDAKLKLQGSPSFAGYKSIMKQHTRTHTHTHLLEALAALP